MRRNNQYRFRTNRDRDAFGEVLNRTQELGHAKGELWRVEYVGERDEHECDAYTCDNDFADVRVVTRYSGGFASDTYCWNCLEYHAIEWLRSVFERIRGGWMEYHQ